LKLIGDYGYDGSLGWLSKTFHNNFFLKKMHTPCMLNMKTYLLKKKNIKTFSKMGCILLLDFGVMRMQSHNKKNKYIF
jgi:hypothetical protein